jgi:hypothetical protein
MNTIFTQEHVTTLAEKMKYFFPDHRLINKSAFLSINRRNNSLVESMVKGACNDMIGLEYAKASFKKLKQKSTNLDILVMIDDRVKHPPKIDAFILIEKGECHKLPSTYSVNLICSHPELKGGGLFLLTSFLYCLKHYFIANQISDQKAILELAGSYQNIQGFITYTKLGFHKDISISGNDCLQGIEDGNLPMTTNLSRVQPSDFLDFLDKKIPYVKTAGFTQLYRHIDDDTGLFNLFRTYTPGKQGESSDEKKKQEAKQKECASFATLFTDKQFRGGRIDTELQNLKQCKDQYEDLFGNARSYPVRYLQSLYKYRPHKKSVRKTKKSARKTKKSARKTKKSVRKTKKSARKTKKSARKNF